MPRPERENPCSPAESLPETSSRSALPAGSYASILTQVSDGMFRYSVPDESQMSNPGAFGVSSWAPEP
ncbi:MAG: hypothetical protein ABIM19_09280 [candidate division WOR-3 bacterium]